jgi:ABC-type multidrug transport system fused ATPase/permease subunit
MAEEAGIRGDLLRHFRPYAVPLAGLLALIVVAALAEAAGLVLLAALLNLLSNNHVAGGPSMLAPVYSYAHDHPHLFLLLLGVTYLGKSGLALAVTYASCSLALRITDEWRTRLMEGLFRLPVTTLDRQHGAMMQLILDEPTTVGFGLSAVGVLLQNALSALTVYVVLLALSPAIAMGLTVMALAALGTVAVVSRYTRRIAAQRSQVYSDGYAYMAEMISAIKQFRLFDLEQPVLRRADTHIERMRRIQRSASFLAASPRLLIELVFILGLALILLALAPQLGQSSTLSAIGLAVAAALRLLPSFSATAGTWVAIQQAWPPIRRIARELVLMEHATRQERPVKSKAAVAFRDRINFRDVSFTYPGRERTLTGVTLEIGSGESVAIVGPSGAGKSTLVDLLCGFYQPDHGTILVDGLDLREADISPWRRQLGVVAQDAFLLSGTVRDNLCLLRPDCPQALLTEMVSLVGADRVIRELPDGYATRVGERGLTLSGGQRQRLALARVLLREPRLLILDEATSALDVESEEAILEGLDRMRGRLAMVFIAHRLSAAARADRIYVLDNGKVVESGHHDALVRQDGLYAALWRTTQTSVARGAAAGAGG